MRPVFTVAAASAVIGLADVHVSSSLEQFREQVDIASTRSGDPRLDIRRPSSGTSAASQFWERPDVDGYGQDRRARESVRPGCVCHEPP